MPLGTQRLDCRGRPAVDRGAHGRLVGLRRGEVEQRVAREARRGVDAEIQGQSGRHRRDRPPEFDGSTFNASFSAFTVDNKQAMALAERRFRPQFKVAFDAWRRTHPERNPKAPKGPTYMPQYKEPALAKAKHLDDEATMAFEDGSTAATRSDDYVRTTVFLASVYSSWWASARSFGFGACGTRSSRLAVPCLSSRSCCSPDCPARRH